ncbi:hypothetical protein GS535_03520 [Saccharibacter sp. EH611]|uniref:hypothetical protein n=1 Tax=unclassified Saccharibacter TaxID=2648722 RepID=UPI0013267921|nr:MULTISPECIES: hypothetical protein [unclassified Saccharibacter]MXV35626.1 hypothetical protein [Saccharibacter sp. EH611]MXV65762.1 hypothetical protein [Saccharibacter sp. EH60]
MSSAGGKLRVKGQKHARPHPHHHKNKPVLTHQCRVSASGCTYVRDGAMKMPGYYDGPRRLRKGASL